MTPCFKRWKLVYTSTPEGERLTLFHLKGGLWIERGVIKRRASSKKIFKSGLLKPATRELLERMIPPYHQIYFANLKEFEKFLQPYMNNKAVRKQKKRRWSRKIRIRRNKITGEEFRCHPF